jgi:phosphatidylglycerol:prolipoprotein diacylglycerol transferase
VESFVSLGRLHIPVTGIFAAAGLMSAMALGLRTAVLAGVDPDGFWNLGFVSVLGAFVISRAVLVIENLSTFLQFPVAVLELPTLTNTGLLCTLVFAGVYLRRHKLPLLGVLDAAAPCAPLFLAFLSVGSWMGGTREGMPTTLPWSVGSSFGRVHPVELYSAIVWGMTCAALLVVLKRRPLRGELAGFGLVAAGLANALLPFWKLPNMLYVDQRLDAQQWRGVEMIVIGSLLLAWRFAVADRRGAGAAQEVSRAV